MKKGIIEHLRWNGDADDTFKNECDGFEWIEKNTFETHIQDITLNVKLRDGTIMNRNGQPLPCKLGELGSDSTSLDPYAYIWDNPDKCILTVLKEEYVNMIKNDDQYYLVSRNDSENKHLFETKNRPQKLRNKPSDVYPTTYESLFVAINYGGFDMKTGGNMIQQEDKVHKMRLPLMTKKEMNQALVNSGLLVTIIQIHILEHGRTWNTNYNREPNWTIFSLRAPEHSKPQNFIS